MAPSVSLEDVWIRKGNDYIVKNVNLQLHPGDFACIYGRSGAGKTSLLRVIALVEKPAKGRIIISGRDYTVTSEGERARARARLIGYIPQHDNVLNQLLVWENIALPLLISGLKDDEALERAKSVAGRLMMEDKLFRRPASLSGGQRRRVAILRALVKNPSIIVADEPLTGLDDELIKVVYDIFLEQSRNRKTIIYATPDTSDRPPCTRVFRVRSGRLEEE